MRWAGPHSPSAWAFCSSAQWRGVSPGAWSCTTTVGGDGRLHRRVAVLDSGLSSLDVLASSPVVKFVQLLSALVTADLRLRDPPTDLLDATLPPTSSSGLHASDTATGGSGTTDLPSNPVAASSESEGDSHSHRQRATRRADVARHWVVDRGDVAGSATMRGHAGLWSTRRRRTRAATRAPMSSAPEPTATKTARASTRNASSDRPVGCSQGDSTPTWVGNGGSEELWS